MKYKSRLYATSDKCLLIFAYQQVVYAFTLLIIHIVLMEGMPSQKF